MGQSERGRESFIILKAKEDTMVEASVTTTTRIYLLSGFICGARTQDTLHYQIKELMQTPISFCEIV